MLGAGSMVNSNETLFLVQESCKQRRIEDKLHWPLPIKLNVSIYSLSGFPIYFYCIKLFPSLWFVCPYPTRCKLKECEYCLFCSSKCLGWCLIHSKGSINICWMKGMVTCGYQQCIKRSRKLMKNAIPVPPFVKFTSVLLLAKFVTIQKV